MDIYSIYLFTNNINGKRYIGQTKNIANRLNQYRNSIYKPTRPIESALSEYGWVNFTFEIIESNIPKSLINRLEQEYIFNLRTHISEWGYNVASVYHKSDYISKKEYIQRQKEILIENQSELYDSLLEQYFEENLSPYIT